MKLWKSTQKFIIKKVLKIMDTYKKQIGQNINIM